MHKPRRGPNEIGILCAAKRELYIATRVYVLYLAGISDQLVFADRFEKRAAKTRTMRKRVGGSALSPREIINYESFESFFFFRKDPGAPHQLH